MGVRTIVMPHPVHGPLLVATFWGMIEVIVGADQDVTGAGVAGVGMEDLARRVLIKDTEAREFFASVASSSRS